MKSLAFFRTRRNGFALVATLSLMILLTIIAVGLLSLSAVSLRSSSQGMAQAEARANARMALILAIGELQKHTGPDTRVTAPADIVDASSPPLTGVWKSWEGADHETSGTFAGRPKAPDYAAKKTASAGGRFLTWLVSGSENGALPDNPAALARKTASANSVSLLAGGTLGNGDDRQVHVVPARVKDQGAYAWWVSGENQKARLPLPYQPKSDTVAAWSMIAKSHAVADPKPFGLESLLADPSPAAKAVSLNTADIFAEKGAATTPGESFLDLSANSVGLLTNTATGGWRKDLSLLTENWNLVPKTNQPFFRVTPDKDLMFGIPVSGGNYRPARSLIYPWSAYRGGNNIPIYEHGAVSSWENLRNWATLYKTMDSNGTAIATSSYKIDSNDAIGNFNFLHKVRIIPIVARIQWVFSHWAVPASAAGTYEPRLLVTPVVTMWNPYNVTITSSPVNFTLFGCLPNAFRFSVGRVSNSKWNSITPSTNYSPALAANTGTLNFRIPDPYSFKPGETLVFSPTVPAVAANANATLAPGFRKQGGHYFTLKNDDGSNFTGLSGATNIKAEVKFDAAYNDRSTGVGVYLDMKIGGPRHLAYRMVYEPAVATQTYLPVTDLASATLSLSQADPQPFLTTIFGARTASKTHLAAKGLVQTSPLVNYTAMGSKDTVEDTIRWDYPGTAHPVNSPFDYSFAKLSGAGSGEYPNADAANRGFIISGFQSSDGLSRCVMAELPTKPIQSLAELQNWDIRYENPIPPYSFNIIGNSDATPLIPSNAVFNSFNAPKGGEDLQHDDSYCANHVFFDDWFVSSIAPKSANLGAPQGSETLKKTFTDFVSGEDPLPNRFYRPILEDATVAATSSSGADGLFTKHASKGDSWKVIASRIEVEGMFNVNSTSVAAWRALLGHARKVKVPYVANRGNKLSDEEDYPFSRFAVAGDSEAKSIGSSGQFSQSAELAGYRALDQQTLERFADEIVKQVRARGPFLSLSEFVNRQLSSGDLALAGTIQAALNALEKDPGVNPYKEIQSRSKASSARLPAGNSAAYKFPDAAAGYNAYGLPGWTRQADVLRPIAPILSARDDTFTIRAYGDARDSAGKVTARATCEAVVRRVRDFVDPADAADLATLPTSPVNVAFGRRYQIVSFRWLDDAEI